MEGQDKGERVELPFKCQKCSAQFLSRPIFDIHITTNHIFDQLLSEYKRPKVCSSKETRESAVQTDELGPSSPTDPIDVTVLRSILNNAAAGAPFDRHEAAINYHLQSTTSICPHDQGEDVKDSEQGYLAEPDEQQQQHQPAPVRSRWDNSRELSNSTPSSSGRNSVGLLGDFPVTLFPQSGGRSVAGCCDVEKPMDEVEEICRLCDNFSGGRRDLRSHYLLSHKFDVNDGPLLKCPEPKCVWQSKAADLKDHFDAEHNISVLFDGFAPTNEFCDHVRCFECRQSMASIDEVLAHEIAGHPSVLNEALVVPCCICNDLVPLTSEGLERHLRKQMPNSTTYHCNIDSHCPFTSDTFSLLASHVEQEHEIQVLHKACVSCGRRHDCLVSERRCRYRRATRRCRCVNCDKVMVASSFPSHRQRCFFDFVDVFFVNNRQSEEKTWTSHQFHWRPLAKRRLLAGGVASQAFVDL